MGHWPLLDAFPELAALAPLQLCELPTPVEPLPSLSPRAWVKRDDVTHPVYGGNKMRKLEVVAAEILRKGKSRVVTFGGTGTNAGVAAAFVCREIGVACEVLTFDQPPSPVVDKNQALMKEYGARLVHVGSLFATALRWYAHPRRLDPKTYFMFAGCSNPVATFGYVNAAFELREQVAAGACPSPKEIVVAAGSGATLAGLTLGCALADIDCVVTGVRVAPSHVGPFEACTPGVVTRMMKACGLGEPPPPVLVDDAYGAGYGVGTDAGAAAIEVMAPLGISLEKTYTAKACDVFLRALKRDDGDVLFWNTFSSRPAAPSP
jgi:D-cysteine desulfhydrase